MKITNIELSGRYKKSFRGLSSPVQRKAILKVKAFRENPFNPQLRTHPLSGREKEAWAFWIDYHYRVKFIFLNDEEVLFLDVDTHDIYR